MTIVYFLSFLLNANHQLLGFCFHWQNSLSSARESVTSQNLAFSLISDFNFSGEWSSLLLLVYIFDFAVAISIEEVVPGIFLRRRSEACGIGNEWANLIALGEKIDDAESTSSSCESAEMILRKFGRFQQSFSLTFFGGFRRNVWVFSYGRFTSKELGV